MSGVLWASNLKILGNVDADEAPGLIRQIVSCFRFSAANMVQYSFGGQQQTARGAEAEVDLRVD